MVASHRRLLARRIHNLSWWLIREWRTTWQLRCRWFQSTVQYSSKYFIVPEIQGERSKQLSQTLSVKNLLITWVSLHSNPWPATALAKLVGIIRVRESLQKASGRYLSDLLILCNGKKVEDEDEERYPLHLEISASWKGPLRVASKILWVLNKSKRMN